jgi:hypothetical protein
MYVNAVERLDELAPNYRATFLPNSASCGGGWVLADIPPPHPARNTALTTPKITSPLTNVSLLFILHLPLGFSRNQ